MSCVNILDNDSTLVTPPTFAQAFGCGDRSSSHDAAALERITFNPDGTWVVNRTLGAAYTGNWHIGAPSNPADFEISISGNIQQVTFTSGGVDCDTPAREETNTPVDSGWVPLSTAVQEEVNAYATANVTCTEQEQLSTFTFTITIRQISKPTNTVTGSGSICADASAFT